jgi:hypothetical protein
MTLTRATIALPLLAALTLTGCSATPVARTPASPATTTAAAATPSATSPAAADDPAGREACQVAAAWQDAGSPDIDELTVKTIHDRTVNSTRPDINSRGNDLYDAWNEAQVQVKTQRLSPSGVQLRMLAPMIRFETACVQARYTTH